MNKLILLFLTLNFFVVGNVVGQIESSKDKTQSIDSFAGWKIRGAAGPGIMAMSFSTLGKGVGPSVSFSMHFWQTMEKNGPSI